MEDRNLHETELSGARLIRYLATLFFTVLAVYLVGFSVWIAIFFRDSGNWGLYQLWGGLIYLLYTTVFSVAAWLAVARVPHRRLWFPLGIVALPALALIATRGMLPRPGGYVVAIGLLLVIVYALGHATFRRRKST